jgi:16S rRNA pseudouridine516 synthase
VGGEAVRRPEADVDPAKGIALCGQDIDYAEHYYIMMNKPAGVVSATEDPRERTALDLLDARHRRLGLFPAGRLDKDATGLLLLTTDGAYAHRLLSPARHVEKEYIVSVLGVFTPEVKAAFAAGITLGNNETCLPAGLEILSPSTARIILREGKYHQIKRMTAALGLKTVGIHRVRMGALTLDETLSPGGWRRLRGGETDIYYHETFGFGNSVQTGR